MKFRLPLLFVIFLTFLTVKLSVAQVCQCTTSTPSGLCYDSRYQADTLDEAIASFPDLSSGSDNSQNSAGCVTKECLDCQKDLVKQLKRNGLLQPDITDILTNQINDTSTCKKYRFSNRSNGSKEDHKEVHDDSDSESDESDDDDRKKRKKKHNRSKRQVISNSITNGTDVIGTRYTISCTTKGVDIDQIGTVSLCSSCWVWRQLPANYKPQYVNELVCDTSDNSCLSGYATCSIGTRTFEAVRSDANGTTSKVSLTAGSYCECRVAPQSSIQPLVTGAGITGTYSPLSNSSP